VRRLLTLAAQRISLLNAETVLLVDHHQPEIEELDVLLDQGMCPDNDAGVTRCGVEQGLASSGSGLAPGQQRHPGADLAAAEQSAFRKVTQHRGDRPEVL